MRKATRSGLSCIKIDRSFVPSSQQEAVQLAMMKTIVELGHHLQLQILVEGVETAEQYQLCQTLGCEYLQGYYYHPPLPFENLISLLESQPLLEA